jgi:hypothetical protein
LPLLLKQQETKAAFLKLDKAVKEAEQAPGQGAASAKLQADKADRDKAEMRMNEANAAMKDGAKEVKQTYHLE